MDAECELSCPMGREEAKIDSEAVVAEDAGTEAGAGAAVATEDEEVVEEGRLLNLRHPSLHLSVTLKLLSMFFDG